MIKFYLQGLQSTNVFNIEDNIVIFICSFAIRCDNSIILVGTGISETLLGKCENPNACSKILSVSLHLLKSFKECVNVSRHSKSFFKA